MTGADTVPARVLIAGVSTRALAASAARAGYQVTAVDAFADLDLRGVAEVIPMRSEYGIRYSPMAAAAAAEAVAAGMVAYTANFENYPAAVSRLAKCRQLLGNPPEVLLRVRDPLVLMRTLRRQGFHTPKTRATPLRGLQEFGSWLLKPRRSGGGHGTTGWRRGQPVPRTHYLQEQITGLPGSVVFAADGRRAVPLALSRQLVAEAHFGAGGFRYCGSLLGTTAALFPGQRKLFETTARLASAVTEEFGLVGLNGIDFIAREGVPYPIEVNPRYSASMELIERAQGLSLFAVHARACEGHLPAAPRRVGGVTGKAIVFARRDVTMRDTRRWVQHDSFADVPCPGEKIRRGRPICTVFARGIDAAACHRLLIRRAAGVYRVVESRKRRAA